MLGFSVSLVSRSMAIPGVRREVSGCSTQVTSQMKEATEREAEAGTEISEGAEIGEIKIEEAADEEKVA